MQLNRPVSDRPVGASLSSGPAVVAHAARNGRAVEVMARLGLAARGVTYLIIALIAAQIAVGGTSQSADQHGALEEVASKPFGGALLIALAVGFAAYACWRFSAAAFGGHDTSAGSEAKEWAQRLGAFAMGLVYAALCVSTILVLMGRSTSSSTQQQQGVTARLLALPFGRPLVIVIGVAIVIGGFVVIWRAFARTFEKRLATEKMSPAARSWATGLGVAGNGAGGVVLVLVGIFLVQAAAADNPADSKGLDQTLRTVAHAPFGPALLLIVTAGLAAYGLYSFVEMRFRRV
ncbi:MAG: DUF1206 domain-containing protein [Candidatus Dormiibacterota bacterium]